MMLCGMGKYGRVMTQYIGIVYDVIFLLLVLVQVLDHGANLRHRPQVLAT